MKNIILLIFSLSIFSSYTYAQKKFAYQIECISVEGNGSYTVRVWNTKKGEKYSSIQARKDAIEAILYSGVPGNNGCVTQKPLLSSSSSIDEFNKIKNDFFARNGIWSKYVRQAEIINSQPESIGDKNWKAYQVSISKDLLIKYLEEKKIIKSLNTGF